MAFFEIVSAVLSVLSVFSVVGNILQYTKKREKDKDLFQLVETHYNNYYIIARALTRINGNGKELDPKEIEKLYVENLSIVRGVADSARIELINFAKAQLKEDVYYQHPAYPTRTQYSDEVLMGMPPEQEK